MRRALHWIALGLLGAAALLSLMLLLAGMSLRSKRHEAGVPAQVTSRVLMVRNFLSDVYAARIGNRVIVFDAGMDPDAHALELLVGSLGADLSAVSDIFLTHGHFDHVAAAARCPKARIHIGAGDADVLAHRDGMQAIVPRLFGSLLEVPAVEATHLLTSVETVEVGNGESVLAVPLPGHTPGSFAYLFDGVLFTGDALLIGEGRLTLADTAEGDARASLCSGIAQLNELFGKRQVLEVCTGHRGCALVHEADRTPERISLAAASTCPG